MHRRSHWTDKGVMALFAWYRTLGITPEDIGGTSLDPWNTGVWYRLCNADANRYESTVFSDLVRISGLSHGTDVWLGNAQTLIENGKQSFPQQSVQR